jgi:hypothetical protein
MTPEQLEERIESAGHFVTLGGCVRAAVAAQVLGVHPRTLRAWRLAGQPPVARRLNARIWYHLSDLVDFLSAASGEKRLKAAESGKTGPTPLAESRLRSGAK